MENKFWDNHYKQFSVKEPSKFAKFCLNNYINSTDALIELGCGNGRDGTALGAAAQQYIGFDACPIAVSNFLESTKDLHPEHKSKIDIRQGDFTTIDFNSLGKNAGRIVIYSRFSLHSIGYKDAENLFDALAKIDKYPWEMLIEARTIYDTLYGEGEEVGLHEFKTDHYRRFIDPKVFLQEVTQRFAVRYFEVNNGFAPFGDQDPLVMRAAISSKY